MFKNQIINKISILNICFKIISLLKLFEIKCEPLIILMFRIEQAIKCKFKNCSLISVSISSSSTTEIWWISFSIISFWILVSPTFDSNECKF